jgi:hypothetical protein
MCKSEQPQPEPTRVTCLLITSQPRPRWAATLVDALSSLARVEDVREEEIVGKTQAHYDLIIVDAAAVRDVDCLLEDLLKNRPNTKIAVATLSRTWRRERTTMRIGVEQISKTLNKEQLLKRVIDLMNSPDQAE